ncbi:MAG: hypothetical protein JXR44_05100 [Thiotrichales bacterium]|nr:hypothetical protein [Thiotrichales bacterium]
MKLPTLAHLQQVACFGIAGNFAGHLEQAGETADFLTVKTAETEAPKGIFPIYLPQTEGFLAHFPLDHQQILYPLNLAADAHLQAEPEVCVLFAVEYQFGQIRHLRPQAFAAFNDCSIRKPNAKKISEKKNWGASSKGIAQEFLPLSSLDVDGELEPFRIASFLARDGVWHPYGQDCAVNSYHYFHQKLDTWMRDTFNHQADFGPLENLNQLLHQAAFPRQVLITLGATTYTDFAQQHFLQPGDRLKVYVYNGSAHSPEEIAAHACEATHFKLNASLLEQHIR